MESKNARPDCSYCEGSGFVLSGETLALCRCVIAAHRISQMIPAGLRSLMLSSFDTGSDPVSENALAVAGRIVEHSHRIAASPLILGVAGECGAGKTTLAAGIVNELFYEGAISSALIETAATLLDAAEPNAQRTLLERARTVDLLVIDDLGGEYAENPKKAAAQLHALLGARISSGLPTLFTTGILDPATWASRYESGAFEKVGARIKQHSLRPPLIVRPVARDDRSELAALLAA